MDTDIIEKNVRELVTLTPHMSLATVNGDKPWVSEVHFAYDDNLNLYFVSKRATRHSQEIAHNPYVAGNIIKQHPLTEAPDGLYFEGEAEQIEASPEDIQRYCKALNRDATQLAEQLKEANEWRMYRIRVTNWAIFGNFDGNGHAKHELQWSSR